MQRNVQKMYKKENKVYTAGPAKYSTHYKRIRGVYSVAE